MRMKKQLSESPKPYRARPKRRPEAHIGQRKPGRKRAVNLAIDEAILAEAKAQGINLSQTLEDELRRRTQEKKIKRWQEENREALESYSELIKRAGIFGEEFRNW